MPITIVNVIPQTASAETNFDSEPNVTVNLRDPNQIVLTAFTPDTTAGSTTGPYFFSSNGGQTWALNSVIPGGTATFGTNDISVRFGPATGTLYAGILRADISLRLNILRKANFAGPGLMQVLVNRQGDDQPWVEATAGWDSASGTMADRVYVSSNDISQRPVGRTASIDLSLNPATAPAPAGFVTARLETRVTATLPGGIGSQDGPSVRTAPHRSGTIYSAYLGWRTFGSPNVTDVVVVRDDAWGQGSPPFGALLDIPGDGLAGRRVVTGVQVAPLGTTIGTQRVGSSLTLAVDPRNRRRVYLAWCDGLATTASPYTIHVRRSDDGGSTWTPDLRTVPNATNPSLAVTTRGTVGLLYQQLVPVAGVNRWRTHLELSNDRMATIAQDLLLANVRDSSIGSTITVIIGDYANLTAAGKDLYGAFSAFNEPIAANFPNGVTYLRNADWPSGQLRAVNGTTPVNASVDPFFVRWTPIERYDDFYVRDWTDSTTSGDDGLEPSLRPAFYVTSDVWNRRGTLPGSFPNDQPDNEPAGNGVGTVGDNFLFARIRRRVAAPAGTASTTVSAHFLVSPLGTGSNFLDATDMDPDVVISGTNPTASFAAADVGPHTVGPLQWHLNPVASTHLCVAVEITAPNDPIAGPSLHGRAPGWPDQDLDVIDDNNKAQRNMGLSVTPARGVESAASVLFAIAHNASTRTRDMLLAFEADGEFKQVAEGAVLWTVGGDRIGRPLGGQIVLKKMAPGENRWIGLRIPIVTSKTGSRATVLVTEFVDGQPVSGFGLGTTRAPIAAVVNHALHRHRSVFARIATHFGDDRAQKEADAAATALVRSPKRVSPKTFLTGLTKRVDDFVGVIKDVLQRCGGDRFDAGPALESFVAALQQGVVADTVVSQAALMECLDAAITELQLRAGNRADVLQNIHWQIDLLSGASALARLDRGARVVKPSAGFVDAWTKRTAGESAYVKLVQRLLPQLERIAQAAGLKNGPKLVDAIRKAGDDPTRVQGAHRNLLLALHGLAWPAVRVRPPRTPAVRSPAVKKPAKKATAKKATAKKSTKKATRRPRP